MSERADFAYWLVPLLLFAMVLIVRAVYRRDWYGIAQAVAWTVLASIPWALFSGLGPR